MKTFVFKPSAELHITAINKKEAEEKLETESFGYGGGIFDWWNWNRPETKKDFKLIKIKKATIDEQIDYYENEIEFHQFVLDDKKEDKSYKKYCKKCLEYEEPELKRLLKLKKRGNKK